MKYILKLSMFVLVSLLIISCHDKKTTVIETRPSHNQSAMLRGVVEKGKVTSGSCSVFAYSDIAYLSKTDIGKDGSYIVAAPEEPFIVMCEVKTYIDDITGKPVTPKKPLELRAVSTAKAKETKLLNINVVTDIIAQGLGTDARRDQIKKGKSFAVVRKEVEDERLKYVRSAFNVPTLGDTEKLKLNKMPNNFLTKISLAVQKSFKTYPSSIASIEDATLALLAEAKNRPDDLKNQDVSTLNDNAIAEIVHIDQWIFLSRISIGTQITDNLTSFAIPAPPVDLTQLSLVIPAPSYVTHEDIYIKGDKPTPVKLDEATHLVKLVDIINNVDVTSLKTTPITIHFCKVAKGAAAPKNCNDANAGTVSISADSSNINLSITS